MGLFDAFKKKEKITQKPFSIFDQFSIDIRNLDKKDFIELDEEINLIGTKYKVYSYMLPLSEFDIFDSLEFYEFLSGERNVFFKATLLKQFDAKKFINFINRLHENLGVDEFKNTKFEIPLETNDIVKMQWLGRWWKNFKPEIIITQQAMFLTMVISLGAPK